VSRNHLSYYISRNIPGKEVIIAFSESISYSIISDQPDSKDGGSSCTAKLKFIS
jgi:hypothetical protein